jgi:hypothetical protein
MSDDYFCAVAAFQARQMYTDERLRLIREAQERAEAARREEARIAYRRAVAAEWEAGRPAREAAEAKRQKQEAARIKREAAAERKEQRRVVAFEKHLRSWPWGPAASRSLGMWREAGK